MGKEITDSEYTLPRKTGDFFPSKEEFHVNLPSIEQLSVLWLFPGLILQMVIGNQLWMIGPFFIGQTINWINMSAAVVIILKKYRYSLLVFAFAIFIIFTKEFEIAFLNQYATYVYIISRSILFCLAGLVMISDHSKLVYKQIMIMCLLNVPIMFLQLAGIGGHWAQFLAREDTTGGNYELIHTLFVRAKDLAHNWSIIQFRPSGFLYSNNRLSFFILAGFALHFSLIHGRYAWGTLVLCAMSVLSMAKIVFLGFLVMVLFLLISGNRHQRIRVFNAFLITIVLFGLYAFLFPGVFSYHMNLIGSGYSFVIRIDDIISTLSKGSFLRETLESFFRVTPTAYWLNEPGKHISGYSYLIPMLTYIMALGIILLPLFLKGLRILRKRVPHLANISALTLLAVVIYPAAVPIWVAPSYWFVGGFALLPLFVFLQPRYFRISLM
jgi:hypothetical protein